MLDATIPALTTRRYRKTKTLAEYITVRLHLPKWARHHMCHVSPTVHALINGRAGIDDQYSDFIEALRAQPKPLDYVFIVATDLCYANHGAFRLYCERIKRRWYRVK